MLKYATQADYNLLAETHTLASDAMERTIAETQDHAFELGFVRAQQLERERIVQIIVREVANGGLNGLDEGDIRGLFEPA